MNEPRELAWNVRRTSGVLVPGFAKRFDDARTTGVTYLWGVPIGAFDVVQLAEGAVELRYRRWPVVDVLDQLPVDGGSIRSAGFIALAGRRIRFCRFRLER